MATICLGLNVLMACLQVIDRDVDVDIALMGFSHHVHFFSGSQARFALSLQGHVYFQGHMYLKGNGSVKSVYTLLLTLSMAATLWAKPSKGFSWVKISEIPIQYHIYSSKLADLVEPSLQWL